MLLLQLYYSVQHRSYQAGSRTALDISAMDHPWLLLCNMRPSLSSML